MQFAKIGNGLISLELDGWGSAYHELFEATDVSMYDMWRVFSYRYAMNPFALNDKRRCEETGHTYWFEIVRDSIIGSEGENDREMLKVIYASHVGFPYQRESKVLAPADGFYVPNDDCPPRMDSWNPFYPGTGIPFETVQSLEDAVERFEKHGINPNLVSSFRRRSSYANGKSFVSRLLIPFEKDLHVCGPFVVDACTAILSGGMPETSSRPAYSYEAHGRPKIVMDVPLPA